MSKSVEPADPVAAAIARAFRDERAIVLATLIRQAGDFQLAEDARRLAHERTSHRPVVAPPSRTP